MVVTPCWTVTGAPKKKHFDPVFRGWDHIHDAVKQLSIRKQLRSSTAMHVHTAIGKKVDVLPGQGLTRQDELVDPVGYRLSPYIRVAR